MDEEDLLEELMSKLRRRRRQAAGDEEIGSIEDERLSARSRLASLRFAKLTELRGEGGACGGRGQAKVVPSLISPPVAESSTPVAVYPRFCRLAHAAVAFLPHERMSWLDLRVIPAGLFVVRLHTSCLPPTLPC